MNKSKMAEKNKDLKDFILDFKITDRQMKSKDKDFTKTTERISFNIDLEVNEAESKEDAKLGAIFILSRSYSKRRYDIECVSCKEKLIKVPRIIIP